MSVVERALDGLAMATQAVMAVFLFASVVVIFLQVFTRYVLAFSLSWSEELARYSSVWITFLGTGLLARTRGHIRMDFLDNVVKDAGRYILLVVEVICSLVFYGLLGYEGARILGATVRQIAPGLQVSLAFVYVAIPVGCAIFVVFAIELLIRRTAGLLHR